jgi:hypothetical protein
LGGFKKYQFKDEINETNFFWWDKKLIADKVWSELPPASKSVFPVIACHCNKRGVAFPVKEQYQHFVDEQKKELGLE